MTEMDLKAFVAELKDRRMKYADDQRELKDKYGSHTPVLTEKDISVWILAKGYENLETIYATFTSAIEWKKIAPAVLAECLRQYIPTERRRETIIDFLALERDIVNDNNPALSDLCDAICKPERDMANPMLIQRVWKLVKDAPMRCSPQYASDDSMDIVWSDCGKYTPTICENNSLDECFKTADDKKTERKGHTNAKR